jgi:hypothetical protein
MLIVMWVLVIFWYDTMTPLQHGNNGLHFKCFHCLYNWTIYVAMISTALKTLYCCGCGSCALVKRSCCRYCITHDIFLVWLMQFVLYTWQFNILLFGSLGSYQQVYLGRCLWHTRHGCVIGTMTCTRCFPIPLKLHVLIFL